MLESCADRTNAAGHIQEARNRHSSRPTYVFFRFRSIGKQLLICRLGCSFAADGLSLLGTTSGVVAAAGARIDTTVRDPAGLYRTRHGGRFNEKPICSSLSASWHGFETCEHLSVCSDGARSGCFSAENSVAPADNIDAQSSTWLPLVENYVCHGNFDQTCTPQLA